MLRKNAPPFLFRDHTPYFKGKEKTSPHPRQLAEGVAEIQVTAASSDHPVFRISCCNDVLLKAISCGTENPVGKNLAEIDGLRDDGLLLAELRQSFRFRESRDFHWKFTTSDGGQKSLLCRLLPVNGDHPSAARIFLLTADRQAELKIAQEAERHIYYDSLTNLPNKHYFYEILETRYTDGLPPGGTAVLYINIFKFQRINESYGYEMGDELLRIVARKIQSCLPTEALLARFEADKFVILLNDASSDCTEDEALALARQIHLELIKKIHLGAQKIQVTATVGISCGSPGLHNLIELLQNAHTAMQRINGLSTDRTLIYKPEIKSRAQAILKLETDLGNAIENHQLELHYQPIISLSSGSLLGFEALTRWSHPDRGPISPEEFIPLAEDSGLILPMGRWCLTTACRQLSRWIDSYPEVRGMLMNVNLSNIQVMQDDVVAATRDALYRSGLEGQYLKLEITESTLVENADQARDILLDLKSLGIKLAIDDFGTGYSSLSYLHRFPVDTLKIDRSFISDMDGNEDSQKLVHIISNLAATLGLDLVAEGIEKEEQLMILRQMGCHAGQGFFISRPLPADQIEKFIRASCCPAPERQSCISR